MKYKITFGLRNEQEYTKIIEGKTKKEIDDKAAKESMDYQAIILDKKEVE